MNRPLKLCSNFAFCIRARNIKIKTYLRIVLNLISRKFLLLNSFNYQVVLQFLHFISCNIIQMVQQAARPTLSQVNPAADTVVFTLEKCMYLKVHLLFHHEQSQTFKLWISIQPTKRILALIYHFHLIFLLWTTCTQNRFLFKASQQIWGCPSTFSSQRKAWDKVLGRFSRRSRQHWECCRSQIISNASPQFRWILSQSITTTYACRFSLVFPKTLLVQE